MVELRKGISPEALAVITEAKAFCLANYENGFDFFVECYSNADWIDLATKQDGNLRTWKGLLIQIKRIQKIRSDYAAEIMNA